ncbi:thiamine pyrophosphate-dependent enzyme [Nonomuraea sp. CA-141351]|uniref:thiamine pyrophosphate-dependent enzyme n=1 Tax=Nonomuraea sp. CA-141351 TaxID=3239996 RepID=UPI003D8E6593
MLEIRKAMELVIGRFPAALYVSTCGFITRDLFGLSDRPANFYMVGSMGMAAPLALGVALARPERKVVILDGDGSLAMNLGCLPMIGELAPDIVHVVLDNSLHESTGGQRTVRPHDMSATAVGCGYASSHTVDSEERFHNLELHDTPALVHFRCLPRTHKPGPRVTHSPQEIVARFRSEIGVSFDREPTHRATQR